MLQTIKYGDAQLIVDFFTEKLGRLSFMVRIPKSSKGRLKRQLFQPLMLLQLEFDYRPKSNLQRIREASIGYAFIDIPFSPYKLAISMFLAELLSYTTKMSKPMPRYISLCRIVLNGWIEWRGVFPTFILSL